jgi:hypothetical protein
LVSYVLQRIVQLFPVCGRTAHPHPDLERAAPLSEALLGVGGDSTAPAITDVWRGRRISLGAQWIELLEVNPEVTVLQQHLRDRAAAPYEIVLAGTSGNASALPQAQMHAARVRVEQVGVAAR